MKFSKASAVSAIAFAAAALLSATAQASVIDTVVDNPNKIVSLHDTIDFTHDFTDQGFIAGTTQYIDGTLSVRLTDGAAGEAGTLRIGAQTINFTDVANSTRDTAAPNGTYVTINLDAASLADLNADGSIAVEITGTSGNFYFADSTLTVDAAPAASAVPEPMSLALVGAGMLGMGALRRRKSSK